MFEDFSVMAARTLVQFFLLVMLFILIIGTIWMKSGPPKEER